MIYYNLAILLCVIFSAFFSASEIAYSSCNKVRLENYSEDGNKRATVALSVVNQFENALSTILICNNLVNIASSSIASLMVIILFGEQYTWLSTVILTVIIIIFGETIPKITAKKNASRLALKNAYFIKFLMLILKPITWIVVTIISLFTRNLTPDSDEEDHAVEELYSIIDTAEDEDILDEDQHELVKAAIDFSDISISEVMTARVDMLAIDIDDDWDEILDTVEHSPYSRIPVYQDSKDNIIGILYLNHFLKAMTENETVNIRRLLMKPCYVYKTIKLPAVLNKLRRFQQHLAIVTDEYGGTLGVVSMEDILEQIVGDIWDETDTIEPSFIARNENVYELDGDMPISEFIELMGLDEDDFDFESDTVGGWAIEMLNHFPTSEETFVYENISISIIEITDRRVERLVAKKLMT